MRRLLLSAQPLLDEVLDAGRKPITCQLYVEIGKGGTGGARGTFSRLSCEVPVRDGSACSTPMPAAPPSLGPSSAAARAAGDTAEIDETVRRARLRQQEGNIGRVLHNLKSFTAERDLERALSASDRARARSGFAEDYRDRGEIFQLECFRAALRRSATCSCARSRDVDDVQAKWEAHQLAAR